MAQLVGRTCVICKKRIISILDAEFCHSCGNSVHLRCQDPDNEAEESACPRCGGAPETVDVPQNGTTTSTRSMSRPFGTGTRHGILALLVAVIGLAGTMLVRTPTRVGTFVDDIVRIGKRADILKPPPRSPGTIRKKFSDAFPNTRSGVVSNENSRTLLNEEIITRPLAGSENFIVPAHVSEPKVLALIPDNDTAFMNVFGELPSASAFDETKRVKRLFDALNRATSASNDSFGKRQLLNFIKQNDASNTIVIIAHSEKGTAGSSRIVRLLNGESVSVDELHLAALKYDKQCLVLTCYGDDFAIRGRLSMVDAYKMAKKGLQMYDARSSPNLPMQSDDFVRVIRTERGKIRARGVAIAGVAGGAGGAGVRVIESTYSDVANSRNALQSDTNIMGSENWPRVRPNVPRPKPAPAAQPR